jgi:hypothetical protein
LFAPNPRSTENATPLERSKEKKEKRYQIRRGYEEEQKKE